MNPWRALPPLLVCLSILCSSACKKEQADPEGDAGEGMVAFKPEEAKRPLPELPKDVVEAARSVAKACDFDERGNPGKCQSGELLSFKRMVTAQRMKAYPKLIDALGDEDQRVRQVAAYAFETMVPYFIADADKKDYTIRAEDKRVAPLDPELARRLLELVKGFDPKKDDMVAATIESAVDAGTLAGLDDEVRELLAALDPQKQEIDEWLYYRGMKRTMRFGRMRFAQDTRALLTHPRQQIQLVAFEAPQQMRDWTDEESEQICSWAEPLMKVDEPQWNAGPARLLLRCNDANTWRNILLDEASIRYANGKLSRPFTPVLCQVCTPIIRGLYPGATETVCNRAEKFFERITSEEKLPTSERLELMTCMTQQWSKDSTLAHMEALAKSSDEAIARRATALAQQLQTKLSPQQRGAPSPTTPPAKAPATP